MSIVDKTLSDMVLDTVPVDVHLHVRNPKNITTEHYRTASCIRIAGEVGSRVVIFVNTREQVDALDRAVQQLKEWHP